MAIQYKQTKDGSWTCFNSAVEEHYHNLHGAYSESYDVYIKPANLQERLTVANHITVLDPFLGLGYNTLTCLEYFCFLKETLYPDAGITLIAIENDPEILTHLPLIIEKHDPNNLKRFLPLFEHNIYYQTHGGLLDFSFLKESQTVGTINLKVIVGDTRGILPMLPAKCFDLIFHDPFSPLKQPELWTKQLFDHYNRILNQDIGAVFTYSAASCVRKAFTEAGFHVYSHPFSICKSGTIACNSRQEHLSALTEKETDLIYCKSGFPYEDTYDLKLSREDIILNRKNRIEQSNLPGSSLVHRKHETKKKK